MPARIRSLAAPLCGIILLAWFVYGRTFQIEPFSGDNIRILWWANHASAPTVMAADPGVYPEWRPLPYLTVWLQYRWLQIDHLTIFAVVNLLLWIGCAWLIYAIVRRLTDASVPAFIAAAVVFVDWRAVGSLIVIECANLLACLFGLGALLMTVAAWREPLTKAQWIGLSLLLLGAGLSKEYGLAFAGAVAVSSVVERRRDLCTAAVVATLMYALLRLTLADGATARYCEEVGYFFELRSVCFDGPRSVATAQVAYNVVATGIGTLVPGVFTAWGAVSIDPLRMARALIWLAVAAIGWWKGPKPVRMTFVVVAANAALSFMLYRARNHLVGLCAVGIAIGVGVAAADALIETWARPRVTRWAMVAALLALLAVKATGTRDVVAAEAADSHLVDPCEALDEGRPLDPAFVTRIKTTYAMPDPDCAASPSSQAR